VSLAETQTAGRKTDLGTFHGAENGPQMTEVDVVLPEGVAEPTTKLASASSSPKQSKPSADDVEQQVTTVEDDEEQVVEEQQEEDEHLPEDPSNEKLELLSAGGKDIIKRMLPRHLHKLQWPTR